MSFEDTIKRLEVLVNSGYATPEEAMLFGKLKEIGVLKDKLNEAEKEIAKSFSIEDAWDEGTVQNWYIDSVSGDDAPVWTEAHISELCNDFWLIKKPDNYREYTSQEEYNKDMSFWCNAVGDLHDGKDWLEGPENLPNDKLRTTYEKLWEENIGGSLCYLAEYKKEPGIFLINEFDEETASNIGCDMEELFSKVQKKAKELSLLPLFVKANAIVIANTLGFDGCHDITVFLPWDTTVEMRDKIASLLYKTVYEI